MKSITDLTMDDAKFKELESDILTQALDNSCYYDRLYDLNMEVTHNSSAYGVISYPFMMSQKVNSYIDERVILNRINSDSSNNYYTPAKVTYMQKIIYTTPDMNIYEKSLPLHVIYSKDTNYARLTGLVDKRFCILSIEINGITVMNTTIQNPRGFINGSDGIKSYHSNVYIDTEYVCNLYNEINCIIRNSDDIQKYRIYQDTKSVFCTIRYTIQDSSIISMNRYQDMIREKCTICENSYGKNEPRGYDDADCMFADMSENEIMATGFTAEKDCNIYKLIHERKKKGLPIYCDCTKYCCYKYNPINS